MAKSWSSSGVDVHLDWNPDTGRAGLAEAFRLAIRAGRLPQGAVLPSTRALAADLGIARGTVTRVYTDLAAEGYLRTRQGAPTTVATAPTAATATTAATAATAAMPAPAAAPEQPEPRWSLLPGQPNLSMFPRGEWLSATRRVLQHAPSSVFGYLEERGVEQLRHALARYLARSRGVVAEPERIVVCAGYSHAVSLLCTALRGLGESSVAFEDPSLWVFRELATAAGLAVDPVAVDDDGLVVSELDSSAVVVTPAHQYPLGVTLAPHRRAQLARWARDRDAVVIEDDYDGEFRFDRRPIGAVQALAPEHIVYAGTASKTLAPGLRLGWLVLPSRLVEPVRAVLADSGWRAPVLQQLVLADLLDSGAYDRHVRRCRASYRRRRDRLLARLPPLLSPRGISAGVQLLLMLPASGPDEQAVLAAAQRHSLALQPLSPHWIDHHRERGAGILVGYATPAEHAFGPTVRALLDTLTDAGL
ncbi:transcriptional regulator with HTH domain and aminotransferase domain [Saccharomonospora marina XMU15]|uniref:Transcriptional regulator with HTH domain and aminotransferase domain n=1 Tax=Saccharomonospora marina XMU15 TaxID=882083 RepID=H5X2X9_9PSEU|nr:PLP-dependent aminotransferase family protein [Saccharomonospora marina]EHR52123.1 transcriptional regulator with HTH domain and aminotransferase domain [Saccharomonospora marina XMU15]